MLLKRKRFEETESDTEGIDKMITAVKNIFSYIGSPKSNIKSVKR